MAAQVVNLGEPIRSDPVNPLNTPLAWVAAVAFSLFPQHIAAEETSPGLSGATPSAGLTHLLSSSTELTPEAAARHRTNIALAVMNQWLNPNRATGSAATSPCQPGQAVQRACIDAMRHWLNQRAQARASASESPINVYKLLNGMVGNQLAVLDRIEPQLRRVHPQVRRD